MARTSLPGCAGLITRPWQVGGRRRLGAAVTVAFSLVEPRELRAQAELWRAIAPWLPAIGALDAGLPKAGGEWLLAGASHAPGGRPLACWSAAVTLGDSHKRLTLHGPRAAAASDADGAAIPAGTAAPSVPMAWERTWGGPRVAENALGCGTRAAGGWVAPQIERPERPWQGPDAPCEPAGTLPLPPGHPLRARGQGTFAVDHLETAFPGHPADVDPRGFRVAPADQRVEAAWRGDEAYELAHWHPERPRIASRLPGLRAALHVGGARGDFVPVPLRLSTVWFFPEALLGVLVFHGDLAVAQLDGADIQRQIVGLEALEASPRSAADHAALWEARTARTPAGALAAMDDGALIPAGFVSRFDALERGRAGHGARSRDAASLAATFDAAEHRLEAQLARSAHPGIPAGHDEAIRRRIRRRFASERRPLGALLAADDDGPAGAPPAAPTAWAAEAREAMRGRLETLARQIEDPAWCGALAHQPRPRDALPAPALMGGLDALRELLRPQATGDGAATATATATGEGEGEGEGEGGAALEALARLERFLAAGPGAPAGRHAATGPAPARDAVQAGLGAWLERARALGEPAPQTPAALLARARRLLDDDAQPSASHARFRPVEGARPPPAADVVWRADGHGRASSFSRLDLRGRDLRGLRLDDVTLVECDLRGARLDGARASDCLLLHCDLADVAWPRGHLRDTRFIGCRLDRLDATGLRAERGRWLHCDAPASRWPGAHLAEVVVQDGDWRDADLEGAILERAVMGALRLERARCTAVAASRCSWTGCDMTGSSWSRAGLAGCVFADGAPPGDWRDSRLSQVSLRGADLRASRWSRARLESVDLSEADLRQADLRDLEGTGVHALRADLRGADLRGASFGQGLWLAADLRGADLRGTRLRECWLADLRLDAQTRRQGLETGTSVLHPRHGAAP